MKIFLTGSTGFLGGHFVGQANAEGAKVIALVRPSSNTQQLESVHVTLVVGDLNDVESLARGMKGCEAVVHIASPKGGWKKPEIYQTFLLNGTRNVISAMKQSGVGRLIYLSTISVHGLDPLFGKPIGEADGFGKQFLPYDYYGRAKVQAEQMVKSAHDSGVIQATVLRPGWVYGPGDTSSYGRLADWMYRGLALKIGDGNNRIPLVYVSNVAAFIWHALIQPCNDYRVYLYAFDGYATQNDYLASLRRVTGSTRPPLYLPKAILIFVTALLENFSVVSQYRLRAFLTRYYIHLMGSNWCFDQSEMVNKLDYRPQIDYDQGFDLTETWYRKWRSL